MPHLHFHFRVDVDTPLGRVTLLDLGSISMRAEMILDTIISLMVGSPLYQQLLNAAVSEYQGITSQKTRNAKLENERDALEQHAERVPVERVLPGQQIALEIALPIEGSIVSGSQTLQLSIRGVNLTFLGETLGIPRRISLFLNGRELPSEFYAHGWTDGETASLGLGYVARIVPLFVPPAPEAGISALQFGRTAVETRFQEEAPLDLSVHQPIDAMSLIIESTARGFAASERTFVAEQRASQNPLAAAALRRVRPSLAREGFLDPNEGAFPLILTGTARVASAMPDSALRSPMPEGAEGTMQVADEPASPPRGNPNPRQGRPPLLFGHAGLNTIAVGVTDGQDQLVTESRSFFIAAAETLWSAWQPLGNRNVDAADLTVAENADGRLEVFVRGSDGSLWHVWQQSPARDSWSDWRLAGNHGFVGRPVVASNADGHLDLFIRSSRGVLWQMWQLAPNGGWSNWLDLGFLLSNPVVMSNPEGRLELFANDFSRATLQRWQTAPNNGWSAWRSMGGYYQGDPVVAKNVDGRLEVFNRDTLGGLWHIWQVAPSRGWMDNWAPAGMHFYLASPPVVARHSDGRLIVFGRGEDNALWHRSQTVPNNGWTAWSSEGGSLAGNPVVAQNADGRLEVFARGGGGLMSHLTQAAPNGPWSGWLSFPGDFYLAGDPVVAEGADGRLSLFVRGTDAALWHIEQTLAGGAWSAWRRIGEGLNGDPVIGTNARGGLDAFAVGQDYGVCHCWQEV